MDGFTAAASTLEVVSVALDDVDFADGDVTLPPPPFAPEWVVGTPEESLSACSKGDAAALLLFARVEVAEVSPVKTHRHQFVMHANNPDVDGDVRRDMVDLSSEQRANLVFEWSLYS